MSWCKESTSVGLSGLTVWEAAKGAMLCEEFQKIPDPLFKPIKEEVQDDRSWFELGQAVGILVMGDEEKEEISQKDKDDKEMETLYATTLEKHRRILKVVRTVSAGHKMVSDGWAAFENACANAGPGELPQLLCSLKGKTNPSPPCRTVTPIKHEPII